MNVAGYGISLQRLEPPDLERLRNWRNEPSLVRHLEFQTYITPEMQQAWYLRINNLSNYYFMIKVGQESIGLIHLANVTRAQAEAGLFIGAQQFWGTSFAVRASLCLLDFAFETLALKEVWAKVNPTNTVAWSYNEQLGFQYWRPAENPDFSLLQLTAGDYFLNPLRVQAKRLFPQPLTLDFNPAQHLDQLVLWDLNNRSATSDKNPQK